MSPDQRIHGKTLSTEDREALAERYTHEGMGDVFVGLVRSGDFWYNETHIEFVMMGRLAAEFASQFEMLKCDDCGTTENVTAGPCPFTEDVHNRIEQANLCPKCHHERIMDI